MNSTSRWLCRKVLLNSTVLQTLWLEAYECRPYCHPLCWVCRGLCFVTPCCDSQGSEVLQHLSWLAVPWYIDV